MRFLNDASGVKRYCADAADILSDGISILNGRVEGGGIVNRTAFASAVDSPVYYDDGIDADETFPVITECSVFYKGRFGRVMINVRDNLMGNLVFEMRLVHPDGDCMELGRIEFSRSNSGDLGYPSSYTVFSGAPIKGCGIFFICRQVYSGETGDFYRIMELSSDLTYWTLLGSDSMYIPTLLANGRGDGWFRAAPYGEILDLPEPIHPQSRNLLSSEFYSYFTTDSASVWFTLPEAELDDASVHGEFSYFGNVYEFTVFPLTEVSEGTDIDGLEVVMLVDRRAGEINFKTADGKDFALPYTGKLNNLKIRAVKTVESDMRRVGSMSRCVGLSSAVSSGCSDVTLFYQNPYFPSEMIWNSPLHPMYFPADNHLALGDGGVAIDRIVVRDKNIFAFKENRIFISETGQFEGDDRIISEDSGAKKVSDYKITFKRSLNTSGAPIGSSVCATAEGICFADRGGEVWLLKPSGGFGFERLCSLGALPYEECFALADKDRYMLFFGQQAFVLERDKKGRALLYRWSLSENLLGGFSYLGSILLVGLIRNGSEAMLFPIIPVSGGEDKKAVVKEGKITTEALPVNTEVTLLPLDTPYRKRLHRLFIEGEGDVRLSFYEKEKSLKTERLTLRRGGVAVNLGILARRPKMVLNSRGEFLVKSILIDHRNIKE